MCVATSAVLRYGLTEAKATASFTSTFLDYEITEYSGISTTTGFGVGAEYAFTQNLSVRGEWLNLSTSSFSFDQKTKFEFDSHQSSLKAETDKITTSGFELSLLYRF